MRMLKSNSGYTRIRQRRRECRDHLNKMDDEKLAKSEKPNT